MIKAKHLLAISAIGALMLACSSKSSPPTPAKDAGETKDGEVKKDAGVDAGAVLSTLCDTVIMSEAKTYSTCLTGPVASWEAALNSASTCSQLAAAVTAGSVKFEPSEGEACTSAVQSLTCPPLSQTVKASFSACVKALAGTVAANGPCTLDVECEGNSFCSGLYANTAPCTGTCKPKVGKGAPCGEGAECDVGLMCFGTGQSPTCVTPPATAALGAACGYDAKTKVTTACNIGLACSLKTLKCVTPVAIGDSCTQGASECVTFAYCDPTQDKCVASPGLGGDCGALKDEDIIECAAPNWCQLSSQMTTSAAGKCAAPQTMTGASCRGSLDCASGRCAVGNGGKGSCLAACPSGQ
jgi:hypothetical protein